MMSSNFSDNKHKAQVFFKTFFMLKKG